MSVRSINARRLQATTLLARRERGFTLIEIMVVVVILGILAAIVVPNVFGNVERARINAAKTQIRQYETAIGLYKIDNFQVPTTDQGLQALVNPPNNKPGGYVSGGIRKDPWGHDYKYVMPGTHGGEYDLYTLGADNQEGGDGDNADIGNWNAD